ncbi:MAG: hypothetical protein OXG78_07085 [Chloroflexi bacterium]|nr:hypothetical protein [Chloroflexota bacterium]
MKPKAVIACVIALILIVLASPTSARDSCYPHDVAYVERLAVIYEEHGTPGVVIGLAFQAEAHHVQNSVRVSGECWVLVEKDWLLSEDLSAKPVTQLNLPAHTPAKLPTIKGDAKFRAQIAESLAYLQEEVPLWYRYVTQYRYTIEPTKPGAVKSYAQWPERRVYVHEDNLDSLISRPLLLVHEACHIHQGKEGRWNRGGFTQVRNEQECVRMELLMALEIDAEDSVIGDIIVTVAEQHWWWRNVTLVDPTGES